MYEPCVDSKETTFSDGLLFTDAGRDIAHIQDYNQLKMTVGLATIFGDTLSVPLNNSPYEYDSEGNKVYLYQEAL
jgi:hypothetical protein